MEYTLQISFKHHFQEIDIIIERHLSYWIRNLSVEAFETIN